MRFALPASTEGNCLKTAKQSSLPEWRRIRRANRAENEAGFSAGTAPKKGRALFRTKGSAPPYETQSLTEKPCEAFVVRFALPASTEGNCLKTAKQSSLPEWRRIRRANRAENEAGFSAGTAPKKGRAEPFIIRRGRVLRRGQSRKKAHPKGCACNVPG